MVYAYSDIGNRAFYLFPNRYVVMLHLLVTAAKQEGHTKTHYIKIYIVFYNVVVWNGTISKAAVYYALLRSTCVHKKNDENDGNDIMFKRTIIFWYIYTRYDV